MVRKSFPLSFLILICLLLQAPIVLKASQDTEPQQTVAGAADSIAAECAVSPVSLSLGVDLVSRYVWRGVEFGADPATGSSSPHFQPTASLTYALSPVTGVSFGFWGSYGFNGTYNESDMFLGMLFATKAGQFAVTVNDYYYPYNNTRFSNTDGDGKGAHTVDAQLLYTMPGSFPLSILVSNNIHNDFPNNKSLYVEASYPFAVSEYTVQVFAGMAKGPSIWHGVATDKFELINLGCKAGKTIKVTDTFSIPVGVAWIYNVYQQKTFLVFKLTL